MRRLVEQATSPFEDVFAQYEPLDRHRPQDPLLDSEVDFDDETDDDQLPLDLVEAIELGVNLDDPEQVADE